MTKRWHLRDADPGTIAKLEEALRLPRPLARLLAARGLKSAEEAEAYFDTSLARCHSPWLLEGMQVGVARAQKAVQEGERITIYGDYDVDGVTSTVLLLKAFRLLGAKVDYYIPDRLKEGYGPNEEAFRKLRESGVSLIISVDCGITSVGEAKLARELGLDFIVTDHHLPGSELPDALALINPKCSKDYPYEMLGGVGVAYKFAQALLEAAAEERRVDFLDHMLELVALGTVCDVAPLDGENRVLVAEGIKRLRQGRWLGLRSLCQVSGIESARIDAGQIGFALGPRLNAGGRIQQAKLGVELLMNKDLQESRAMAQRLDQENRERQRIEKEVLAEAMLQADARLAAGDRVLVLWGESWHPGVVGLVASRILEKSGAPCIVLACDGGIAKGSARSRRPFHMLRALESQSGLLSKFGGHEFAAGMSLPEERLDDLRRGLNRYLEESPEFRPGEPSLEVDATLVFGELDAAFMKQLEGFEPFGLKNPRPLFIAERCTLLPASRAVGADASHLKLSLRQGVSTLDGIAFRQAERLKDLDLGQPVDLAFNPDWNEYQGRRSLQLDVRDMRQSS